MILPVEAWAIRLTINTEYLWVFSPNQRDAAHKNKQLAHYDLARSLSQSKPFRFYPFMVNGMPCRFLPVLSYLDSTMRHSARGSLLTLELERGQYRQELDIPESVMDRIILLLYNNPNSLIRNRAKKDDLFERSHFGRNNIVTCHQLTVFLASGIIDQDASHFEKDYEIVDRQNTDEYSNNDFLPGDIYALAEDPREYDDPQVIHSMLYLGGGIFMSKMGTFGIYFHPLSSVLFFYGEALLIFRVIITSSVYFPQTQTVWKQHQPPRNDDDNPPPPPTGAVQGALEAIEQVTNRCKHRHPMT